MDEKNIERQEGKKLNNETNGKLCVEENRETESKRKQKMVLEIMNETGQHLGETSKVLKGEENR